MHIQVEGDGFWLFYSIATVVDSPGANRNLLHLAYKRLGCWNHYLVQGIRLSTSHRGDVHCSLPPSFQDTPKCKPPIVVITQYLQFTSITNGGAEFAGQENDGQRNFRGWKLQNWKMTDKSAARKNVKHVVLSFKNHQTKLINVHDLGVSVSSIQSSWAYVWVYWESDHPFVATTAVKKWRMLTSVYEAPWQTQTEHNIRFQKAEVLCMRMRTNCIGRWRSTEV